KEKGLPSFAHDSPGPLWSPNCNRLFRETGDGAACDDPQIDVGVTNPDEPITELIAKSIVNVTATGERNPREVMERALNALGVSRPAGSQNSPTVEEDRGARSGSGSRAP